MIAVTVFWGISFVATKIALETMPTFTLVFIHFSVAGLFFFFLMLTRMVRPMNLSLRFYCPAN